MNRQRAAGPRPQFCSPPQGATKMDLKLKSAADVETEYTNPEPAAGGENISVNLKPAAGALTKYTNREAATGGQKNNCNLICLALCTSLQILLINLRPGRSNAFVQNTLDPIHSEKTVFWMCCRFANLSKSKSSLLFFVALKFYIKSQMGF